MIKKPCIQFYFDVISPYSWIGFEALEQLRKQWNGVDVKYVPFSLFDAMKKSGNKPPAMVPNRAVMLSKDVIRSSEYWGMKLKQPAHFFEWIMKYNTQNALNLLIVLQRESEDLMMKAAREMWNRLWFKDQKIFETEDFVETLKAIGVQDPERFLNQIEDKKITEILNANNSKLEEDKVYGAPWIIVHTSEGEAHSFFGSDRFHLIAELLKMPPPISDKVAKNWTISSKM